MEGKTPISFLQELCTKRGITPQYDLIANEGAIHEPTFVFKVTAGTLYGTGKGPSKKKAKHNAALSVLNQMKAQPNNGDADFVTQASPDEAVTSPETEGNPVGELHEFTQKKLWPPPLYDCTSEQGPPHARAFICTVTLFNISEQGVGSSKKLAKRNAASAMMRLIKDGVVEPMTPGDQANNADEYDEDNIPLPQSDVHAAYTALKEGKRTVNTLTPQASQHISQFYLNLKSHTGKNLTALQSASLSGSSINFCQMLQEIADEQKFEVTYVDIQEKSRSGEHQCLVQLSSMPVAVCHGTGTTHDSAHSHAAHNALQYLRIMTKK